MTPHARRLLIERHLPLVRSIARRYAGAEPLEDLAQVGAIGLIKAADRFDEGVRDLYRTAEGGGTFCYTFFKAVALNPA